MSVQTDLHAALLKKINKERESVENKISPRLSYMVVHQTFIHGVSSENTLEEAMSTAKFYAEAGHKGVAIYVKLVTEMEKQNGQ